ncbi:MAG TPA: 2'-5' RNA ligase family protein [Alphaproteobacteria bacterium]|nr:2'-5' RNA ligase family protein [Alphaproteobacteria bacterium]
MQGAFEFYRDLPARPKHPERLFFGLLPAPETAVRVRRFAEEFIRKNCIEGTRLKTDCLHVSLHHVGDYKRLRTKIVYAAQQAGNAVAMRRFEMTLYAVMSFERLPSADGRARKRPLVLLGESDALSELHEMLGAAMRKTGLRAAAGFAPHMTLCYGATWIPAQAIEPIRIAVNEFALIHSELGRTRYNVVNRWLLETRSGI